MQARARSPLAVVAVAAFVLLLGPSGSARSEGGRDHGGADWPLIGGDWANSRYSTLDAIDTGNVSELGAAWLFPFEGRASTRATPVVEDGVMYIGSGTRLYAIDGATGATIWSVRHDEDAPATLDTAGFGDILNAVRAIPSPPGVALGAGKVFVGLMDGRVASVSQETGEFIWATQIGYDPPRKGQAVSGAPLYVDGRIYVGLANGDWAFRGKVVALDAETGELLWEFYTIPRVRVTPIAYNPETRYLYAQGTAHVGRARRITNDPWFRGGAPSYTNLPDSVGVFGAIDTRTNRMVWKHEVEAGVLGTSGPLTTAGGLMFRGSGDGTFQAYDARTGAALWRFQTGVRGSRGPSITYEAGGEQYVALAMGPELWAFKLGGTVPERDAPPTAGRRAASRETNEIMTSTLVRSAERGVGLRYAVDEHAFSPPLARVGVGTVVTFVNSGGITHTITAQDASWTTGPLLRAQSGYVLIERAGTFTYHCEDHPWAMGQITVEP
jgi:outer membrane protein assembly factor BamB/plastocyanin